MKINRKVGIGVAVIIWFISIIGIWAVGYYQGYNDGCNECEDMIFIELEKIEKDSENIIFTDRTEQKIWI